MWEPSHEHQVATHRCLPNMELVKDISYDLWVIAGPADTDQHEFRASSKALAKASPVFAAMFGPNFSEGQKLRDPNRIEPVCIALPDDNPVVMRLLCDAISYDDRAPTHKHHTFVRQLCNTVLGEPVANTGQPMELSVLVEYAAAVDKYLCREAAQHLTNKLLIRREWNWDIGTGKDWNQSMQVLVSLRENFQLTVRSHNVGENATDEQLETARESARGDAVLEDVWRK